MLPPSPQVFLYVPCYGGQLTAITLQSVLALEAMCAARSVNLQVELSGGEALISRARGGILTRFLASGADRLFFVDADVGFPPDALFRLLETGKPLVGGAYPKKVQPTAGTTAWEADPLPGETLRPEGLQPVASVGAGFLLIARDTVQRITEAYPQLRAKLGDVAGASPPEGAMVFDSFLEPETGRYLADHQAFCRRWRDIGGEVWAHFGLGLRHEGAVVWGG